MNYWNTGILDYWITNDNTNTKYYDINAWISQLQQGESVNKTSPNNNNFDHYGPRSGYSSQARDFPYNLRWFSRYTGNDSQQLSRDRDNQNRRVPLPPREREENH